MDSTTEPLKVGSWVTIRNSGLGKGCIVEFCGPLGPGGSRIYRARIGSKPVRTTLSSVRTASLGQAAVQ